MQITEEADAQDPITGAIIGAAIEVHRTLGPGLLESIYERCLCHEMDLRGINYAKQVDLPIVYKDLQIERALRIDILASDRINLELKSVEAIAKVHEAQILSDLRLSGLKTGLILNFNVPMLKSGVKRYSV